MLGPLRKTAKDFAYKASLCGSYIDEWTSRLPEPDRMRIRIVDPWPGRPERGQQLCEGELYLGNDPIRLPPENWDLSDTEPAYREYMHSFEWLRDLRACKTKDALSQALHMIECWIIHHEKPDSLSWRPDLIGQRISAWINLYDAIEPLQTETFHDFFMISIVRQARILSRQIPGNLYGIELLKAAKGLLYAGLVFEGYECWSFQALDILEQALSNQILEDGGHISRSPAHLLETLQILTDIRTALCIADCAVPSFITNNIKLTVPALKFFRHNDGGLALFSQNQESSKNLIDTVIGQAGARGKMPMSLPDSGYERATLGRTHLLFNTGTPPPAPYNQKAHLATLTFEMSYGKDRVFVSCGTHPASNSWSDALKEPAAHCTATLDNKTPFQRKQAGTARNKSKKTAAMPQRQTTKETILLEAKHHGYLTLNGFIHHRRLFLDKNGQAFKGEDRFSAEVPPAHPIDLILRFHIHPRVLVSLISNGCEALLRLPGGIGWRFQHIGGALSLENSVYLGEGYTPRKTKQLVIHSTIEEAVHTVKWGLIREG